MADGWGCKRNKDGSLRKRRQRIACGVWLPESQTFCAEPRLSLRRCRHHYAALKRDGLFESLQQMSREQRERALDTLDAVQKQRDPWTYRNDEGERILMEAAAAQDETENSDDTRFS